MAEVLQNPFTVAKELDQQNEDTKAAAKRQADFFPDYFKGVEQANLGKALATKYAADEKIKISNETQAQTEDFQKTVQPLLQRAQDIARQKQALVEMNPLKRMWMSNFKRDYSIEELDKLEGAVKDNILATGNLYSANMNAQDNKFKATNERFEANLNLWEQRDRNNQANFRAMQQGLGVAKDSADASYNALVQQQQARAAQFQLKTQTLSTMTQKDMFDALAQAKKNGGTTNVNGAELSQAELQHGLNDWDKENTSMDLMHVSLASGRLDLKNKVEDDMISRMPLARLNQIAADGGKYRGAQLDLTKVASAIKLGNATQAELVQNQMMLGTTELTKSQIARVGANQNVIQFKSRALFGQDIPELTHQSDTIAAQTKIYTDGLIQAQKNGTEPAYVAKYGDAFDKMRKQQDAQIDALAEKWGGGDPNKVALAKSYYRNEPISPDVTSRALISISEHGMPIGARMGPVDVEQKKTSDAIVAKYARGSKTGLGDGFKNTKDGEEQRQKAMADELTKTLASKYQTSKLNEYRTSLPDLARTVTDEHGLPFDFSKVPKDSYQRAQQYGLQKGLEIAAAKFGMGNNPEQFATMLQQGPSGPIARGVLAKDKTATYDRMAGFYVSSNNQNLMWALKHDPNVPKYEGFDAADAFVKFANHPNTLIAGLNKTEGSKHDSVYEFGVSQIAPGGIDSAFQANTGRLRPDYTTMMMKQHETERASSHAVRTDPYQYANATLAKIQGPGGISDSERKDLMNYMVNDKAALVATFPDFMRYSYGMKPTDAAIDKLITTGGPDGKFKDPYLEGVRKKAAKDWAKHRQETDSWLSSLQDEPKHPKTPTEDALAK